MKKLLMMLVAVGLSLSASAQFEQGKTYIGASVSNFDLNFNSSQKWSMDLGAKAGKFVADDWLLTGNIDYSVRRYESNYFKFGAGIRYYIIQNGLYLGAGASYLHHGYDDFMPSFQMGYAFFINKLMTLEPEFYYNQSLKDHGDYSGFGFRLGLGIYLDKLL